MFSTQSTAPSTGGFSFGSTSSTPAGGSTFSFGSANNNVTQPTASSFSFGQTPSTTSNSAAPASGFGFGTTSTTSNSAAPTSGFGFGQNSNTATPGASGFGFGTTGSTSSAFGSQSTTPSLGFGSNTTTPATSSGSSFGTTGGLSFSSLGTSNPAPSSSFSFGGLGGNTSSFGSQNSMGFGQQTGQPSTGFGARPIQSGGDPNRPAGSIFEAIDKLERSYAPVKDQYGRYQAQGDGFKNDECQFKTIKLVPKPLVQPYQQIGQQQMAPSIGFGGSNMNTAVSQNQRQAPIDHLVYGALLEEIERDNVDPAQYIPVEEVGIESLRLRYENQGKARDSILKSTDQLSNMLGELNTSNQTINEKFRLLKMKQLKLNESLLKILRKIEVLRCHGNPLQATEISFRNQLHRLALDVEPPFKKLQDISINLALQNQPKDLYEDKIDEEDLMNLIGALKKQSEGLEYLAEVLRKDTRDIGIMKNELNKMT